MTLQARRKRIYQTESQREKLNLVSQSNQKYNEHIPCALQGGHSLYRVPNTTLKVCENCGKVLCD